MKSEIINAINQFNLADRQHYKEGSHYWVPTYLIATKLKISCSEARKHLSKMEKEGIVKRNEKYSGSNSIAWELT